MTKLTWDYRESVHIQRLMSHLESTRSRMAVLSDADGIRELHEAVDTLAVLMSAVIRLLRAAELVTWDQLDAALAEEVDACVDELTDLAEMRSDAVSEARGE